MQITTDPHSIRQWLVSQPSGTLDDLGAALESSGQRLSKRHVARLLNDAMGEAITRLDEVRDGEEGALNSLVIGSWDQESRSRHLRVFVASLLKQENHELLLVSDRRGERAWLRIEGGDLGEALVRARAMFKKDICLVPHGELHQRLQGVRPIEGVEIVDYAHRPLPFSPPKVEEGISGPRHDYLDELEAESIRIIREAVSAASNPGMLFSMGKDSMVMWTLARKAFWPEPLPFPLVIIDTRWKFQDMYRFRHWIENLEDTRTIVHINPDAIANDVNPFDFGSATHTDITKTQALKQILDTHRFDFVFGGARRDEERSRAKERVFSLRNERHGWDPKNQRPELWNVYNTTLLKGQSMRVFPLSNWTELDVWRYIEREQIPVVPLYFSKTRPFVERDGALIMVDDERFRLEPGERIQFAPIRFRTLGCYPLTGGVRSHAQSIGDIIAELELTRVSERSSRVIDFDPGASMEQKKKDGYF